MKNYTKFMIIVINTYRYTLHVCVEVYEEIHIYQEFMAVHDGQPTTLQQFFRRRTMILILTTDQN